MYELKLVPYKARCIRSVWLDSDLRNLAGRGELMLSGKGVDNGKAAENRITLMVRRNLIAWTEEVRPAGSGEAFAFRHRYVFTRAEAPAVAK